MFGYVHVYVHVHVNSRDSWFKTRPYAISILVATHSNPRRAQEKLAFEPVAGRRVEGRFDGKKLSTDGGLLLIREVATSCRFFTRLKSCFIDARNQDAITHSVESLIQQRVYGLLAGYEDLQDHDDFRHDPVAQIVAGRIPGEEAAPLAGHSTLGRLELTPQTVDANERDKKIAINDEHLKEFLIQEFIRYAKNRKLKELVLDIDATDIPLHGNQEDRFYHRYYGHYCYLPLYIFCEDFPLWAQLRYAGTDAASGTVEALTQITDALKAALPGVKITVRADSAFAREEIMEFCEKSGIFYLFGLARNSRLEAQAADAMDTARVQYERTKEPARVFCEFSYQTSRLLELCPTGCCQGRVSAEGSKSALYRNEPERIRSKALRGALLQTRRCRESHQGAVSAVCRQGKLIR